MLSKAQQFILSELNNPEFEETSDGSEIHLDCVFCGDYRKKLYVSHEGKGICFLCGTRFNSAMSFVMQYEHISKQEALKKVKGLNNQISADNYQKTELNGGLFETLLSLHNGSNITKHPPKLPTNTYSLMNNFNNPVVFPYFNYLKARGISLNDIKKYNIMYTINGIYNYNDTQLAIKDSIVFPTYDNQGELIYWNTRSIVKTPIKSINAPSDKGSTFTKQSVVWNANNIHSGDNVVICEGVFNAIMADKNKYVGVATFGKQITDEQLEIILKNNPKNIYVALDNDAYSTAIELVKRLSKSIALANIYFVTETMLQYPSKDFNDLGVVKTQSILDETKPLTSNTLFQLQLKQLV